MPNPPTRPASTVLHRAPGCGRLPAYTAHDGRFVITRNPATREVAFADSGWTVTDGRRANVLGHPGVNAVRVFELDDVRAVLDKVMRREYLAALQRYLDRGAAGARR